MKKGAFRGFLLLAALAVLLIGGWWYYDNKLTVPNINPPSKDLFSSLSIDFGNGEHTEIRDLRPISEETVFSLTKKAMESSNTSFEFKSYPGVGSLVTRIGEQKNGEGGAYWQFWVNGKYADKAADNTAVVTGDKIEWKFSSSTPQ